MPNERTALVAEVFKSAVERDEDEWPSFLELECNGDAALRGEVESLLKHHQRGLQFLERTAVHDAAESLVRPGAYRAGQIIGDYEIVSLIGRGGMGEVYLAQDRQLQRKVALKLIRHGMDSDDLVRHFKREEHLLASLNHPNIAQLYGGGVSADGIPFFAMEFVEGQRLDEYCDERQLMTKERLQLFRKVCSAVTYAHQHLVIHRDLKPANIRVTADGEPKLLDFGIAKLLDPQAQVGEQTITMGAVMTPEYASPEQIRGESITTASDIYSLGVVLYELLTGEKPYDLTSRKPHEISRAITDQEPSRPSLITHHSPLVRDRKNLRGDLDNIILKALRKELARRYVSVGQFSEDIRRHLDGLPVVARKDTFVYRASKFVSRHRIGVAAAAVILMTLVAGMVGTAWQARSAHKEEMKAEEIKNFLERMLNYSNPYLVGKDIRETTVSEVLDEAAKQLESEKFSDQPKIKAELEEVISGTYYGQGKYDLARRHLQKYLDLQSELGGQNAAQALTASQARAALLFDHGELTEAEKLYRQILPPMRKEKDKGNIKADTLAHALNNFAFLRRTQGDSKEAESLFREALTLGPRLANGSTRSTLASTLADQGRFQEALQTAREAVADYRKHGETKDADFAFALTILGGFLTEKGDYAEADSNLRAAEVILRKLFASSNLWLGDNLRNQAISFYQQGRYVESLSNVSETLNIYREKFGRHYDHYPTALIIQGLILAKTGQPEKGEKILREAVQLRTESLPKEHYWVALAQSAFGECLTIQKRYDEAEPLLLASYESLKNSQGANNPRTMIALQRLVALYEDWGKSDAADAYRASLN